MMTVSMAMNDNLPNRQRVWPCVAACLADPGSGGLTAASNIQVSVTKNLKRPDGK